MLWPREIVRTLGGRRYRLHRLGLHQPDAGKGVLRAWLFEEEPDSFPSMYLCSKNSRGDWIVHCPAPSLQTDTFHPDLHDDENEFVLVAHNILAAMGSEAPKIEILLDTHQNPDYRQDDIAHVHFTRDGSGCGQGLDFIPGVRTLEKSADMFWNTFKIEHFSEGGTQGEFEFTIKPGDMQISYEDLDENKATLKSILENGVWLHTTELILHSQERPNVVDELKNLRGDSGPLLQNYFANAQFAPAFPNPDFTDEAVLSREAQSESGSYRFSLRPGALRGHISAS